MPLHLTHPSIYLITDRQAFRPKSKTASDSELWQAQLAALQLAAQAGCQFIQIREKDLAPRELSEFTRAAIALVRPYGAKVLVNNRLDVALAAGADGVHLRVNSLPVAEVRRCVAADFLVAASTHSLAEAQTAARDGADFIVCGPVFDTPSKREYGAPLGIEAFAKVCRAVSIPVFALGGIKLENFRAPLVNGAAGIAAIGLFTQPDKLVETVQTLRQS
ncbi:MAG: thiamine phosphate synthase [Acidobacteria bacterium]|nr:thiamine phosphate synthase [Acidobacteriota bacterium]